MSKGSGVDTETALLSVSRDEIQSFAKEARGGEAGLKVCLGGTEVPSPADGESVPGSMSGVRAPILEYGVQTSHARGGRRGGAHGRSVWLGATIILDRGMLINGARG